MVKRLSEFKNNAKCRSTIPDVCLSNMNRVYRLALGYFIDRPNPIVNATSYCRPKVLLRSLCLLNLFLEVDCAKKKRWSQDLISLGVTHKRIHGKTCIW